MSETSDDPVTLDRLIAELRLLRKGDGATVSRIAPCVALTSLRQVRGVAGSSSPASLALAAYQVLRTQLLNGLPDDKVRFAARALGVGVARRGNLTVRRGLSVAEGYGLSTVREWEDEGLLSIAYELFGGHVTNPQGAPSRLEAEFDLDNIEIDYRMGPGKQPEEWIDRRTLRSRVDGLRDVLVKHLYTGSSQVHFQVISGGWVDEAFGSVETATGFKTQRVVLNRSLRRNETLDLVVRKRMFGNGVEPQPFLMFIPEQKTQVARISVHFLAEKPSAPKRTICLAHSLPLPVEEPEEICVIGHTATARFDDIKLGYGYGITWAWNEP